MEETMFASYYYYDMWTYLLFVGPALILSVIAQFKVSFAFKKYSKLQNSKGFTGSQAADMILSGSGIYDVVIEQTSGILSDHYDSKTKAVRLSPAVYNATSVAAVSVAAHEAGHAIQHRNSYKPLIIRNVIIPVTKVASNLAVPLFLIGLLFEFSGLMWAGILFFAGAVVFQLITLPVEYNASRKALASLKTEGILYAQEIEGAKKVLSAAALTYVAAMFVSLMQFLRLVMLAMNRRRN
jgi:Zn-dependent membrane protease YugP